MCPHILQGAFAVLLHPNSALAKNVVVASLNHDKKRGLVGWRRPGGAEHLAKPPNWPRE